MRAYVEQKRSGSSFVGGYLSGIPAHFDSIRLTVIDTKSCIGAVLMHMWLYVSRSNAFFG